MYVLITRYLFDQKSDLYLKCQPSILAISNGFILFLDLSVCMVRCDVIIFCSRILTSMMGCGFRGDQ